MDGNPLLHVQFPSTAALEGLKTFLEGDLIRELKEPKAGILVARDPITNDIVSYARWDDPPSGGGQDGAKLETGELRNLKGCRREFLERYAALAGETKKRAVGDTPCYHLTFVCTDPMFQGLGAGTLLTRHILMKAKADRMPVYLESTLDAVHMYERLGFKRLDKMQMGIPQRGGDPDELSELYEEVCMVWWPDETSSSVIQA
ncbi:hypothetical protein CONLIGDRAFT_684761 [Coniochaeta ligniaria NRRL 30616]|uniref:N-acetyltransferase domain-containing protein n=1 Tax=Coniochaeta ligniaria NRRL 30616 TaxID=1408157 RepID=A0A1J7IAZ8_9PEZI|nr:hypothetical protein CONLIGDRAFT_684761 [Coniochaeta ligniaria NRRL 30616]